MSWQPFGLQEMHPRLVARARHLAGGQVDGDMAVNRAHFDLEVSQKHRFEAVLMRFFY